MSLSTDDRRVRLIRHLTGEASEAEREALEQAVLEDDALFDQLAAHEGELVDAYVRGELDETERRGVSRLLDVSARSRAHADTTLALTLRGASASGTDATEAHSRAESASSSTGTDDRTTHRSGERPPGWRVAATLLALALIIVGTWSARRLTALRQENEALRRQAIALEARLDQLEAAHRALAQRLARIESSAPPPGSRPRTTEP